MFEIKFEINGKQIDINDSNAIEDAITKAMVETAIESVKETLTPEEAAKITITVKGDSADDLSLNISGPEEIVEKIERSL